jgi:putative transposase
MINKEHLLSITKQCHILQLSRSGVYYMPAPVSDKDAELMRLIDEIHLEQPYLGSMGMKCELRSRGQNVGRIHVFTLMRKMGIEALYKKSRLSKPHPDHKIYPYLLRGLDITEASAVWCSDTTYPPPLAKGFFLPRCHYGLDEQKGIVLEIIKLIRRLVLHRGYGGSNNTQWNTGHI